MLRLAYLFQFCTISPLFSSQSHCTTDINAPIAPGSQEDREVQADFGSLSQGDLPTEQSAY